jgi:hypothetical protein
VLFFVLVMHDGPATMNHLEILSEQEIRGARLKQAVRYQGVGKNLPQLDSHEPVGL